MKVIELNKPDAMPPWRRWGMRVSLAFVVASIAWIVARGFAGGSDTMVVFLVGPTSTTMTRFTARYIHDGNITTEKTWYFAEGAAPKAIEHRVALVPGDHNISMIWTNATGTREDRTFVSITGGGPPLTIDVGAGLGEIRPRETAPLSARPTSSVPVSARPMSARPVSARPGASP